MATIDLTDGDDVYVADGGDTINGSGGNDTIGVRSHEYGFFGPDVTLNGGDGNDALSASNFAIDATAIATLNGGAGDDTLTVLFQSLSGDVTATAYLNGGGGNDVYVIGGYSGTLPAWSYVYLHEDANGGVDEVRSAIADFELPENFENLTGTRAGGNQTLVGNSLDNVIEATGDSNGLYGEAGNDFLIVNGSSNQLAGGEGDDFLIATGNDNELYGETGSDYFEVTGDRNKIDGSDGYFSEIHLNGDNNSISVGDFSDIVIEGSSNTLAASSGSGRLHVYGASNQLQYSGDINVTGNANSITINPGNVENTIWVIGDDTSVAGSESGETVEGNGARANISGNGGDDFIQWTGDHAAVTGGFGADSLETAGDFAYISGGEGDDIIIFTGSSNTVLGGEGDDTINVTGDNNSIEDNAGNDTIRIVGDGNSVLRTGDDEYSSLNVTVQGDGNVVTVGSNYLSLTVDITGNHNTVETGNGSIWPSMLKGDFNIVDVTGYFWGVGSGNIIEHFNKDGVPSGQVDIEFWGDNNSFTLAAEGSFVSITGANNSVIGGIGSDQIFAAGSGHTITAGDGNDVISYHASGGGTKIYGNVGNDTLIIEASDVSSSSNTFYGGAGNDTYELGSLAVTLVEVAGGGTDLLKSAKFNLDLGGFRQIESAMLTGAANLALNGNAGDNVLTGNAGFNHITGGIGADTMSGGAGTDVFDFNSVTETGVAFAERDWIMDFVRGSDHIDLATIDASTKSAGNNAFKFIGTQGFHHKAGEVRFGQWNVDGSANDRTIIVGDVNGDGVADFRINLKGLVALSAGDFVL